MYKNENWNNTFDDDDDDDQNHADIQQELIRREHSFLFKHELNSTQIPDVDYDEFCLLNVGFASVDLMQFPYANRHHLHNDIERCFH